jgi:hypothetical protein
MSNEMDESESVTTDPADEMSGPTVHQANSDLLLLLAADRIALVAQQLAQQEGEAPGRPIPEYWMRKACEVMRKEAVLLQRLLGETWWRPR